MGTWHIIKVVKDGIVKINQFCQWDGYPQGAGVDILEFLKDKNSVILLKAKLDNVRFLDFEQDKEFIENFDNPETRTKEMSSWYDTFLSRDLSTQVLHNIIECKDEEIILQNTDAHLGDCWIEWKYVIDFDKNTLTVTGCGGSPVIFELNDLPTNDEFFQKCGG